MTTVSSPTDLIDSDTTAPDPIHEAAEIAEALRRLANMIAAHPELAEHNLRWAFNRVLVPVDTRQAVVAYTRAGLAAGARISKHQSSVYAGVDMYIGPVMLHVYVERQEICDRVVTGTHEVTEEVPDPEALAAVRKVTVTKTVEDVEWVCRPILADGAL